MRRWCQTILVASLVTITQPAHAVCDSCVVGAIERLKAELINQFSLLKEQLASQVKTLRQSIAQVEKDSLRAQADLAFIPPAGGCETATAGAGAGPARDRAEAYQRAFTHLRRAELDGSAASAAMAAAQIAHYCTAEDVGSHGCQQAGERPDAQFQTETLLAGSGLGVGADPTRPNTFLPEVLSFNDDRITDARRFIDNAVDPFPLDDVPKTLRETAQGKAYWLKRKLYEGRLSASRYSFNHALAVRMPAAALKGWLLQVWQESKAAEHRPALSEQLPETISYWELLKTEVDRRYASPTWYAGITGDHPAAVLRELAFMEALGLELSYLQLRQGERIELLLAQLNAGDTHARDRPAVEESRAAVVNLVTPPAAATPTPP